MPQNILHATLKFLFQLSRAHIVIGFFILGALYIFTTIFRYTVVDHAYYQKLADSKQLQNIQLEVNRGTIYTTQKNYIYTSDNQDSTLSEQASILATSATLKNVAIDPSQPGSDGRLKDFLAEVVHRHICEDQTQTRCYKNLQKFLAFYEPIEDFQTDKDYLINKIQERLSTLLNQKYQTARLIRTELPENEKTQIESLRNPGLYFYGDNLYVNPEEVDRSPGMVRQISQKLGENPEVIGKLLERREKRYILLLKRISIDLREYIEKNMEQEKSAVNQDLLVLEDTMYKRIILEDNPTRFYPEEMLGSQIVGFIRDGNKGQYGIEGYFQDQIAGKAGKIKRRKDSLGRPIENLGEENEDEIKGVDVYLTIDRNIQKEVENILEYYTDVYGANSGSAIVMDPHTGKVLSMASYPSFNPNRSGNVSVIERFRPGEYKDPLNYILGKTLFISDPKGKVEHVYDGEIKRFTQLDTEEEISAAILDPSKAKFIYENGIWPAAHLNKTITSLYEPGSVFKAITVAIGIDAGEIEPDTLYNDVGSLTIDNFEINNLINEKCEGLHTFRNALNFSCNVGMVRIIQKIGRALTYKYIKDFGFGEKTGIELQGEITGKIDSYDKWSRAKLFTTSFGQGIQVTQLQMAAAYSVLANGGIYYKPYIVHAKVYPNGEKIKTEPTPLRRVITEETSQKIIAMLTEGAQIGFAKAGSVKGYDVAGKTGTSQIASRGVYETGGVGRTITSFGGFAPSQNPQFVIVVKFERPRNAQYAADTAAPVFREIADYLLKYHNIPKNIGE